ncbi:hypothetical protein H7F33_09895 [Pedobacter sp. PAMC26386]|nr:hypothetical protein H7F33_09895 [Pedobacter sp. PAMC26386]
MNTLKKITCCCRKAIFLVERKHTEGIAVMDEIRLLIHLKDCPVCRIFQEQSLLIDCMMKRNQKFLKDKRINLSDDFKNNLKGLIQDKLVQKTGVMGDTVL